MDPCTRITTSRALVWIASSDLIVDCIHRCTGLAEEWRNFFRFSTLKSNVVIEKFKKIIILANRLTGRLATYQSTDWIQIPNNLELILINF